MERSANENDKYPCGFVKLAGESERNKIIQAMQLTHQVVEGNGNNKTMLFVI